MSKFTDPASQQSLLLCGDSMYGANVMDGKFKVLALGEVVASAREGRHNAALKETYSAEVPYGVQCIEHFNIDDKELLVAGLCDGTIQVFDYTKNKDKGPLQRPVFRV